MRTAGASTCASGACVTAGEDIRTYAVDVRDGAIFVDVDVEPTAQELALRIARR